jgi:LPPG:FO 2-phospho-L-lactate transferase
MKRRLVVALAGGVGAARFLDGLTRVLAPERLFIIGNTADDAEIHGLHISPDLDTVTYTLAGLADPERGWGIRGDRFHCLEALERLGAETWFRLGDRDLAVHVERTRRLRTGETLSAITTDLCRRLGVGPRVLPMSDDPVRTRVRTDEGWIDFQDYFVHRRCEPVVHELAFHGAATARAQPDFLAALTDMRLAAVVICPSNPFISIEPILAVPGVRTALADCAAPVIAVSPIIGGRAVKGPTAKMMAELGMTPSASAVAHRYGDLIDGYVVDFADMDQVRAIGPKVTLGQTMMTTLADREALARTVLQAAGVLTDKPRR